MVASLSNATSADDGKGKAHGVRNRVFDVLKSRLDSSKTFGANMIFMLNRACTFDPSSSFIAAENVL